MNTKLKKGVEAPPSATRESVRIGEWFSSPTPGEAGGYVIWRPGFTPMHGQPLYATPQSAPPEDVARSAIRDTNGLAALLRALADKTKYRHSEADALMCEAADALDAPAVAAEPQGMCVWEDCDQAAIYCEGHAREAFNAAPSETGTKGETPRTDALESGIDARHSRRGFYMPEDVVDLLVLARTLERELADAIHDIERGQSAFMDGYDTCKAEWKESLESAASAIAPIPEGQRPDVQQALEARQDAHDAAWQLSEDGFPEKAGKILTALTLLDTVVIRLERDLCRMERLALDYQARYKAAVPEERAPWQPIETAPKDGIEFVAAYGRQGFVKKFVTWDRIHSVWTSKGAFIPGFEENATHWMPLPSPPPMNKETK